VADHLGPDGFGTEPNLEEAARDLSRAEARDADLFLQPAKGLVNCASKLLLVDLDGELDSVAL
jgi:hypothetical protein